MKKLALGLVLGLLSVPVFAAEPVTGTTNVVFGGAASGAGNAVGAGALITTNAALITAGVITAGAISAGSRSETATTHQ